MRASAAASSCKYVHHGDGEDNDRPVVFYTEVIFPYKGIPLLRVTNRKKTKSNPTIYMLMTVVCNLANPVCVLEIITPMS